MVQKKSFGLFCLIFLFIFVEMHSQNMPNLTLSREKFIPIYPLNNANLNGPRLGIKILPEMPSGCITENRIVLECINCLYNNGINYISFDLFFEDCSGVKWKKGVSLPANSSSSISIGGKAFVNNQREQVIFGLDNSNKFNGHFTYKAESPGVITNFRITNGYEGTDNQIFDSENQIPGNLHNSNGSSIVKRDPEPRKDYANVFWNSKYTLFDLITDEPIFPIIENGVKIYRIYYSSNENPMPFNGEFTERELESLLYYKFKDKISCLKFCNSKR
jgi:hypothetical protein